MTELIEKGFLLDPLNTNNAIYPDSLASNLVALANLLMTSFVKAVKFIFWVDSTVCKLAAFLCFCFVFEKFCQCVLCKITNGV